MRTWKYRNWRKTSLTADVSALQILIANAVWPADPVLNYHHCNHMLFSDTKQNLQAQISHKSKCLWYKYRKGHPSCTLRVMKYTQFSWSGLKKYRISFFFTDELHFTSSLRQILQRPRSKQRSYQEMGVALKWMRAWIQLEPKESKSHWEMTTAE